MEISLNQKKIYTIAEIGHNHQGNIETAIEMFKQAKLCGVDAVKLQKRNNKELYTKSFYETTYENKNSYGKTYGEHREKLEFNENQYKTLIAYAKEIKIDFFVTPFDFSSVDFLEKLNFQAYKIASADLINIPLIEYVAKTNKTIFLSTGGGSIEDVSRAKETIFKYNKKLSILHCTASYPTEIADMNLKAIVTLKKIFPEIRVGLSDHENGIDAGPIAYMLGATIFEKHFTLDRSKKGTDQAFSLEPIGLTKFVRNLKRVDIMLGSGEKKILDCELEPLYKMKKSVVAKIFLKKGDVISLQNICYKSPGGGIEPYRIESILGKKVLKDLAIDTKISFEHLE